MKTEDRSMITEDQFSGIPLADLTNPQKAGPLHVYRDHWWIVKDGEALFFHSRGRRSGMGSPQCNVNRQITEHINRREVGRGEVVFVPWAYVPFNVSDYQ